MNQKIYILDVCLCSFPSISNVKYKHVFFAESNFDCFECSIRNRN